MLQLKFEPIPARWVERMRSPAREQVTAANKDAPPSAFASPGRRNNDMARLAGFAVGQLGMNAEQVEAVLGAANGALPEPLPEGEAAAVARSIANYGVSFRVAADDIGLSRQIAERLAPEFRAIGKKQWLHWDGQRWDANKGAVKASEAIKRVLTEFKEGLRASDPDDKRAGSLCSARAVRNMTDLAVTDDLLQISPSDLDANSDLLNLRNGVLHLPSGELRPHDPGDLLTMLAGVKLDAEAECPIFDAFMERIQPDPEVRGFILRILGYALLGDPTEHKLFIFHGRGRNGKSVLLESVKHIFGDYAKSVEPSSFVESRSERIRSDIARLVGARLVTASELNPGQKLDASLTKKLTGGDTVTARGLYQAEFEFRPAFVPIMATNSLPIVMGNDEALARRLVLVAFDEIIPESEVDLSLPRKLRSEAPGIFQAMLRGLADYRANGLSVPSKVRGATADFIARSDLIRTFVDETLIPETGGHVGSTAIYQRYQMWAIGEGVHPMSKTQLQGELAKKLGDKVKDRKSQSWGYLGWAFASQQPRFAVV